MKCRLILPKKQYTSATQDMIKGELKKQSERERRQFVKLSAVVLHNYFGFGLGRLCKFWYHINRELNQLGLDMPNEQSKQAKRAFNCKHYNEKPICKIGDTVYQTDGYRIYSEVITKIIYDTPSVAFDEVAIGKSIFLTREEAEAKLKELQSK